MRGWVQGPDGQWHPPGQEPPPATEPPQATGPPAPPVSPLSDSEVLRRMGRDVHTIRTIVLIYFWCSVLLGLWLAYAYSRVSSSVNFN